MTSKIHGESELIATYLVPLAGAGGLGLADDAAVLAADGAHDLIVTTDPIIRDVHFFADDAPRDIAWKALAVNVSDLVAKGAEPVAYTLALAFPEAPEQDWMADFARGLKEAQSAFGCRLIGGDTDRTPGVLSIGVTAFGQVAKGGMIRRLTARAGDHVFVSGTIGDAALGLMLRRDGDAFGDAIDDAARRMLIDRYLRPAPRCSLIPLLRADATAALDVSDGLVQDAGKLAGGANAALAIRFSDLPLSPAARGLAARFEDCRRIIAAGGDDYEVLFAVPHDRLATFEADARCAGVPVTEIGILREGAGVSVVGDDGAVMAFESGGYDHFRGSGAA